MCGALTRERVWTKRNCVFLCVRKEWEYEERVQEVGVRVESRLELSVKDGNVLFLCGSVQWPLSISGS